MWIVTFDTTSLLQVLMMLARRKVGGVVTFKARCVRFTKQQLGKGSNMVVVAEKAVIDRHRSVHKVNIPGNILMTDLTQPIFDGANELTAC